MTARTSDIVGKAVIIAAALILAAAVVVLVCYACQMEQQGNF